MAVLVAAGVPMTVKREDYNGCKCGTYRVGKRTIFIG